MNRRITCLVCLLGLAFIFLTLTGVGTAEVLHNWLEPHPYHAFDNGHTVETNLFSTHTSKNAERSESEGSWRLRALATASANASASLPRSSDWSQEFNVHGLVRATGDRHEVEPHTGDGLAKTVNGEEIPKRSPDGKTTASTKRKAHPVLYKNKIIGPVDQRSFDVYTSGDKSETSVSSTDLDADPWAKAWLEVRRRTNLAEEVRGSPFTSTTPKCSSSGNGHTCEGATPPPERRPKVYCRRQLACNNKPGIQGDREAHKIKCPNRTYKQGTWAWLLIKLKEDCKGEKWSCHSDPTNCTRKHLHLNPPASNGTVINGVFVPSGYSIGACSEHLYASGSASDHALKMGACGHTYYTCLQGDHDKLQASCSTDSNCISRNFYACENHSHSYLSSPTDNTPDCPDCTTDCSSPCSCSNSGTCGGSPTDNTPAPTPTPPPTPEPPPPDTPSYHACGTHLSTESGNHSYGTLPCGTHAGYACRAARSHTQAQTCPGRDGKACTIGSYYVCTRPIHEHIYPETQDPSDVVMHPCGVHDSTHRRGSSYHRWVASCSVKFGSDSCTVSGGYYRCTPHEHRFVATCAAGHSYNPESDTAYNRHRVRTCRFSECRQTWQRCQNSTPICNKPYRKQNDLKCWAE